MTGAVARRGPESAFALPGHIHVGAKGLTGPCLGLSLQETVSAIKWSFGLGDPQDNGICDFGHHGCQQRALNAKP